MKLIHFKCLFDCPLIWSTHPFDCSSSPLVPIGLTIPNPSSHPLWKQVTLWAHVFNVVLWQYRFDLLPHTSFYSSSWRNYWFLTTGICWHVSQLSPTVVNGWYGIIWIVAKNNNFPNFDFTVIKIYLGKFIPLWKNALGSRKKNPAKSCSLILALPTHWHTMEKVAVLLAALFSHWPCYIGSELELIPQSSMSWTGPF